MKLTVILSLLLPMQLAWAMTDNLKAQPHSVIIVGAGMSGISAARTLSDAGIKDLLILEASDHIGGRIHKYNFDGIQVEMGANWIEGVNGQKSNPIWEATRKLCLRNFYSDYSNISHNTYNRKGGLFGHNVAEEALHIASDIYESGVNFSQHLRNSGQEDISILVYQRLKNHVPITPLEMVLDFYTYDYELSEPPRVTSLKRNMPLSTFVDFGKDIYFLADQRGYESVVYDLAHQFLKTDKSGSIVDSRIQLNKVVRHINHSRSGVTVTTEDGTIYKANFVMISVSIGVLQTDLIQVHPHLPEWKTLSMNKFDMSLFTKIFLKFPYKFWPQGNGTEFFLYASERRGFYPVWQHLDKEYPGANVLLVIVTDDEARRIELLSDGDIKNEAMVVLKKMFGKIIPDATHIHVCRWWTDRFYKGSFSNWPIGVDLEDHNQIKEPVGRIYFTGEHTSEKYNGYVHGAYFAEILTTKIVPRRTCLSKSLIALLHYGGVSKDFYVDLTAQEINSAIDVDL